MAINRIDAAMCERLINAATSSCKAPAPVAPPAVAEHPGPNWDGVVTSLTSLSTAFVWGSILLAVAVIALAMGWAYLVRGWAKDEAKKVAQEVMKEWLERDAPKILREAGSLLNPKGDGLSSDAAQESADEIGKVAG